MVKFALACVGSAAPIDLFRVARRLLSWRGICASVSLCLCDSVLCVKEACPCCMYGYIQIRSHPCASMSDNARAHTHRSAARPRGDDAGLVDGYGLYGRALLRNTRRACTGATLSLHICIHPCKAKIGSLVTSGRRKGRMRLNTHRHARTGARKGGGAGAASS